jgi:hypothetical protein
MRNRHLAYPGDCKSCAAPAIAVRFGFRRDGDHITRVVSSPASSDETSVPSRPVAKKGGGKMGADTVKFEGRFDSLQGDSASLAHS